MSDIERERIRKESVDAVASRPPRPSEEATGSALRRYLGLSMFQMLRGRRQANAEQGTSRQPKATRGPKP
jgi:hypothetical protein